jgi:basic membrane protein A
VCYPFKIYKEADMKKWHYFITAILVLTTLALVGCTKREAAGYKIGVAFDNGGKGDRSFNESAYAGLVMVAEEFGGFIADEVNTGTRIEMSYLEPEESGQDRETLMRAMAAEEGHDLIFGVGPLWTDHLAKIAGEFPDIHFVLIDGFIPDLTADSNITSLSFAVDEGSFILGVVAGLISGQSKIGFLGSNDIPQIHEYHGGFIAGAMYMNTLLRADDMILSEYIADPESAESTAVSLYNQGCSIIYQAAGPSGSGLFKAARDLDKRAIGADSDQGLIYASSDDPEEQAIAKHIITSMVKRVDIAVFSTSKDFIEDGNLDGGYRELGLEDDAVGFAVNDYNRVSITRRGISGKANNIKAQIIRGEIEVPDHDSKVAEWKAANLN